MGESFVGALDQGTTSTRFVVFDGEGQEIARHQLEHAQVMPRPGWLEHDPVEVWERSCAVIHNAMERAELTASDLAAIGIANQRETTVVWDRRSGRPLCNAIVWQDTRTSPEVTRLERDGGGELVRRRTGLRPATYFSATKLAWILDNVEDARAAGERGDALFGTIDSWLVWNLTGGEHVTDVTNASRTMLMDLETLDWDDELLELFRIPRAMLPAIRPSTDLSGALATEPGGPFEGPVRIAAMLGDQQAAMIGQACFAPGDAKCTYGTGSFVLMNTGTQIVRSERGLLSTVCYQLDGDEACYALEGSVAVSGAAVQWLRDQLGIVSVASESESLAREVPDSAGLYFVPAFSGLFAPYWRPDARGAVVGMSRFHTGAHLARATLEAICYQTRDVIEAMAGAPGAGSARSSAPGAAAPRTGAVGDALGDVLVELKVDGGVTANDLCMQTQADVLGADVVCPVVTETTALGAASAAGLAAGVFASTEALSRQWKEGRRWSPEWSDGRRAAGCSGWSKAVERTLGWVDGDDLS